MIKFSAELLLIFIAIFEKQRNSLFIHSCHLYEYIYPSIIFKLKNSFMNFI